MKSVAFHNLGCKVNSYEMDVMQQIVQKAGYEIVQFTQKADAYIVNTCTVTSIADRKSRQMLHRAKSLNPEAVVVAVGCYAQTGLEELKKDSSVDIIIGNNHKTEIAEILDKYFLEHPVKTSGDLNETAASNGSADGYADDIRVSDLTAPTDYEASSISGTAGRTRADVKIQDGCNQFCAYCAIPLARGRVRSRKPDDIMDEIRELIHNGYKEVVITGIHISSYGIDFDDEAWDEREVAPSTHYSEKSDSPVRDYDGQSKLFDLMEMIEDQVIMPKDFRIRMGSFEPRVITEWNVERLVNMPHICPHFHLSLQSGCDDTLKRMNRRYSAKEYADSVERLRSAYNKAGKAVAITTDVIVGFPGETDGEFDITRDYLENLKLYEMHVFKYSRRKNTLADKMPNQVSDQDKNTRSDCLLDMTAAHSKEYRQLSIGRSCNVLFEESKTILGRKYYVGHTDDYIMVALPVKDAEKVAAETKGFDAEDLINCFLQVNIKDFVTDEIMLAEI